MGNGLGKAKIFLVAILGLALIAPGPLAPAGAAGGDSTATAAKKKCKKKKKRKKCKKRKPGSGTGIQDGQYSGTTSQGFAVSFTVAGRAVTAFSSTVNVDCIGSFGGMFSEPRTFTPPPGAAPIDSAGAFSREASDGSGSVYKYSGRFGSAAAASGVLNLSASEFVFGGVQVCATPGDISWSASRVG